MMMPLSSPADRAAALMGLGALALVLGALGLQLFAGIAPCEMCHWQRWPHLAAALCGLIVLPLLHVGKRPAAIIVTGIAALAGLFAVFDLQMLAGWQPLLIGLIVIGLIFAAVMNREPRKAALAVAGLVLLSGLIGAYQTGMQWHLLPGPSACTGHRFILGSHDIPQVQCDVVTWTFLGQSLAFYNALISVTLAGLGIALLRKERA
jgi:disulfide bond formation protein DsbB